MNPHIIRTNGEHEDFPCPPVYDGQYLLRKQFEEVVGGYIEHAWVEYEGRRTCMIVNETGAVQDPPLPGNVEASRIYHTGPAKRDGIPVDEYFDDAPKIHGDVVLLDGVTVE